MSTNEPILNTPTANAAPRILLPLDGSDLAAQALPVAEAICGQISGNLDLVTVLQPVVLPYLGGDSYVPGEIYQRIDVERTTEAEKYLERMAAQTHGHNIPTRTHLQRGDPASRLLDLASELGSALIVMTTHGRTGLARFALGSVADRVVRGGEAPVLLIRSFPTPDHEPKLAHALVPLDGSLQAEAPLFTVTQLLAGPVFRTITLLRVADPRDGEMGRQLCENYLTAVRQRLLDRLGDRECDVSVLVRSSKSPAATIVETAQDGECDLVFMSTRGEAGIGRWAFGGVTDRVLRDGKTPLLLAHPGDK